jgi:hypothetical protein
VKNFDESYDVTSVLYGTIPCYAECYLMLQSPYFTLQLLFASFVFCVMGGVSEITSISASKCYASYLSAWCTALRDKG